MLRLIVRHLALPALVLLFADAAFAGELVEGDGYELRVPPGYRALPTKDEGT